MTHEVPSPGRDDGPGWETVWFSLDAVLYEVDLPTARADALRAALAPYVCVARPAPPDPGWAYARLRARAQRNATIRDWARAEDISLAAVGRIPEQVERAWWRSVADTVRTVEGGVKTTPRRSPREGS